MYAIVVSGGKQHKVSVGDVLKVELINKPVGEKIELDIALKADEGKIVIGSEAQALKAQAEIVSHGKDRKIVVFKYKPKKNIRKKQGHRQPFTQLRILSIG